MDAISLKNAAGLSIKGMSRQLAGVAKAFSENELIERLRASTGEMVGFYTKLLASNYSSAANTATSEQVAARIDPVPEEAWSRIRKMEDEDWCDRALAEYSQIHLHVFDDPDFLKVAQGWRKGWEDRQGK